MTSASDRVPLVRATSPASVRPIDPLGDARWDSFVRARPDATAYHLSAWSAILADAYRFQPRHLALERDGELLGVLPLMGKKGPLSGRRLRSLPVVQTAGPLGLDADASARLASEALEIAGREEALLVIASRQDDLHERVCGLDRRDATPTWILDVPAPADLAAWEIARSKNLRRSISKARRANCIVRLANDRAAVRTFHRLYLETMRKHRSLPRTYRQFEASRRQLARPAAFALFAVEDDAGAMIAGGLFHVFNGTAELIYNASDASRLGERPNHALYRYVVEWASERGIGKVDFGGAWTESPLAAFKRQWGAEEVAEYTYVPQGAPATVDVGTAMTGGAATRLRSTVDRLWEQLPLPATELAASVAYRWL
jgi:hypothetical protein